MKDKREQILAEVRSEIQKHEFRADSDKRSIQELTGIIDSQRMEIDHAISGCEQSRRDQLLLQEELSEQNRYLGEARIKCLHEMEELKRVQELRVDEFSIRKLIENQDTIHELTTRIQELQNEDNCMIDSRDLKDAESVRSGPSYVPSQPALLPSYHDQSGLLSRNTIGNVFANPRASNVTEDKPVSTSTGRPVTCDERQTPDTVLNPRFQT